MLEGLLETPRTTVMVFNKSDRLTDPERIDELRASDSNAFVVSARTGAGLDPLREFLWRHPS